MAGIGFKLERLAAEGGLVGGIAAVSAGAFVASGHWLLTILGIGVSGAISRVSLPQDVTQDFRLIAIYAFGLASAASMVVTLPATRSFSDALYERKPEVAPRFLIGSCIISGCLAAYLAAFVFAIVLRQPIEMTVTGVVFSAIVALLWTTSTFCSAVFAVRAVLASYLLGTLIGILGATIVGFHFSTSWGMALAYCAGLSVSLGALIPIYLGVFPFSVGSVRNAIRRVARSMGQFPYLTFGALLGIAAIWSSTLVIWASDFGESNASGFRFAEVYDTPHFLGLLTLVPGFALLIVFFETALFRGLRAHYALIEAHAALEELEASAVALHSRVMSLVTRLTATQVMLAIAVLIIAPIAAEANWLQLRQVSIMQITALGTVMHLVIVLAGLVLIYLDARKLFFCIQGAFLLGTVIASIIALPLGERFFGIGYLIGTSIGALISMLAIQSVLERLNEHIFMNAVAGVTRR